MQFYHLKTGQHGPEYVMNEFRRKLLDSQYKKCSEKYLELCNTVKTWEKNHYYPKWHHYQPVDWKASLDLSHTQLSRTSPNEYFRVYNLFLKLVFISFTLLKTSSTHAFERNKINNIFNIILKLGNTLKFNGYKVVLSSQKCISVS